MTMAIVPAVPPAPPVGSPRAERRLPRRVRWLAGAGGLATLALRLPGLDRPRIFVFDEIFYATQGWEVSRHGVEQGTVVHPPLAKWLLAAGIRVFGFSPWGWRIVPLLAGVVVVMATIVAAYRLIGSEVAAGVAGLVVLTDGIAFTTGRLALLDGIVAAFTTVALAVVATALARPLDVPLRRRCTLAAALCLGGAVACKWSAAPLLPVVALVLGALAWRSSARGSNRRRELARIALTVVVLPALVYVVCFIPTFVRFADSSIGRDWCGRTGDCHPSLVTRVRAIASQQRAVLHFHETLVPRNRYAVNAATWVFQTDPVGLVSSTCPSDDPVCSVHDRPGARRVIGVSTPAIWALGTAALAFVLLSALWLLDLRRGLVSLWAAALWLPWVIRPVLRWFPIASARPGYTFYAAPLVPVVAIALGWVCAVAPGRRRWMLAGVIATIAIGGAVVLYPVWTAHHVSTGYLQSLIGG